MRGLLAVALLVGCHHDLDEPIVDAAAFMPVIGQPIARPPYPIVLAHGLFGFSKIGPLDYFYGVIPVLEASGRTVVAKQVDAVQSSDVRGAQLVQIIEDTIVATGADKVIVIGHSQGGIDARWAAAHDSAHVAAVVTIGTPHRGSPIADVATAIAPGDSSAALNALGTLFGLSDTSFVGALDSLTTAGSSAFNAEIVDVPGIPYYSVAGRSDLADKSSCPPSTPFLATWDGDLDTMDAELLPTAGILSAVMLPATPTQDGLVTVDSATWGTMLGCVPADHLNEVCQIAGAPAGIGNGFDCLGFYRGLEQYLTAQRL